jgi:class 3 adenylate cyclase
LDYYPLIPGQPDLEDDDIELEEGILPGYVSLYDSGVETFSEIFNGSSDLSGMTGVEEGIYIINNQNFTSLEGIEAIKSVDGPIVISNNPKLYAPIADVLSWLTALETNVSSVDLSYNDFYGEIPDSYCDLLQRFVRLDLSHNINLCGPVPNCMSEESHYLKGDDYLNHEDNIDGDGNYDNEDDDYTEQLYEDEEYNDEILDEVSRLQSYIELWGGNNLGSTCEYLGFVGSSNFSDSTTGCSPLGHTGKLGEEGKIVFDSLTIDMQEFKGSACSWQRLNTASAVNKQPILLLDFDEFYTDVSGGRSICNDFSSGHNFYTSLLNGPVTDEFKIKVYNQTYKRGLDVFSASGSERPPPFALQVDPSWNRIKLDLQQKDSYEGVPQFAEFDNDTKIECGTTLISYYFEEPLSSLSDLRQHIAQNYNSVTRELGSSIVISDCDTLVGNDSITDLSSLKEVAKLDGSLVIVDCPSLQNVTGLEKLENVTKSIVLHGNSALSSLSGLKNLKDLGGSLVLKGNKKLVDLKGLESLSGIRSSLSVEGTSLQSLSGLDNVLEIGGQINIQSNPSLLNLDGLFSLTRTGATILIKYNEQLTNLSGLEFLMGIGGSLDVQMNKKLLNLTGLENLVNINGSVAIMNNPELASIEQLPSLKHVRGSFVISSNEKLQKIHLPRIKSIGSPHGGNVHYRARTRVSDEGANHIFAIEYHPELTSLEISNDIQSLPWNVYVIDNELLSGFIPWNLLTKDWVRFADISYNNYSGPVDPFLCENGTTIETLILSGNEGICGELPEQCPALSYDTEGTSISQPCKNVAPPKCMLSEENRTCFVISSPYSSNAMELSFMFPKYELQDTLPSAFNDSIKYQFGVGTSPDIDNVNPFTEIIDDGADDKMISHTWNIEDRHISLVNGQKYYVLVNAYDLTGVSASNITSVGTTIDIMPPNVTEAKVYLDLDTDGAYKIEWKGFKSMSGLKEYDIVLRREGKDLDSANVLGKETTYSGRISPDEISNGTLFQASVVGVSMAGLKSMAVKSASVMPIPAAGHSTRLVIGAILGIIFACLLSAALVAFFVRRYLKKQQEQAREEAWLQKLNNSVYTYLQGSSKVGKLSEEGSTILSKESLMDVGNRKDLVFLFTDIQSSTELCEQNADAYLLLQEAHDEIIRNALAESGGHEVDTEGDAFMCMFQNVESALLFCFKVQEELLTYEWPSPVLALRGCEKVKSQLYRNKFTYAGPRVRMAIHLAQAGHYVTKTHPTTRRIAYGGSAWNTTRILSDVGHGGQILVSEQAWKHLNNNGDEGAAGYPIFEDLGCYRMESKDAEVMRILQASPARSPIAERVFPGLKDVDMVDSAVGMNIVPSLEGKVAIVGLVIEPAFFLDVVENFITLIARREVRDRDASKNAPDTRRALAKSASSQTSPTYLSEYENPIHRSSLNKSSDKAALQNNQGTAEGYAGQRHFTSEHQQAVTIVTSIIESLVSQFGGYAIQTVEDINAPPQVMLIAFKSASAAVRFTLATQATLMEYPWPKEIKEAFQGNNAQALAKLSKDKTPLFNGPCVAMSAHVERIEKISLYDSAASLRTSATSAYKASSYKYKGILEVLELAHIACGGQTILSSQFFDAKWQKGLSLSQTRVTDLGVHDIKYFKESVNLIEILPKILQDRTDCFPPVSSERILSVGAQNAPGAGAKGEPVALVFTYPRVAHAFQKADLANEAVDKFSETVRILLSRYNGYESQEVGTGCFFLSFPTVDDAVAWSIHLQLILRRSDWNLSDQLLSGGGIEYQEDNTLGSSDDKDIDELLRSCSFSSNSSQAHRLSDRSSEHIDSFEDSLFSFSSTHTAFPTMSMQMRHLVLVQIGICYGVPTKVTPHVQTGRADYFGPLVNLSARVAKQTKPGDVHLSSYADLSQVVHDRSNTSCYLKGMEFANEGKWVDIDFQDRGKKEFKGVRDKRRVYSVRISCDPFSNHQSTSSSSSP